MANLRTLCIDGTCMDNIHPTKYLYEAKNYTLASGQYVDFFNPLIVIDKPCWIEVSSSVYFTSNATGARYARMIKKENDGTPEMRTPVFEVSASSWGYTYLSLNDFWEKTDTSTSAFGLRLFQNSGSTLNISMAFYIRLFETLSV